MNGKIHAPKEAEAPKGSRLYKEDWNKSQKARDFANALDSKVSELFHGMAHALKSALDAESEQSVIADITEFLRDEKGSNQIDSCIRWLILFRAAGYAPNDKEPDQEGEVPDASENAQAQSRQGNERKAIVKIVEIIANMEAYLCFETPQEAMPGRSRNRGNPLFKQQCRDLDKHWQYSKKKSTPFYEAVSNDNHEIVQRIIRSLERYCEQQAAVKPGDRRPLLNIKSANTEVTKEQLLIHVLRQPDPSSKRTALQEAARDQQVNLKILEELLRYPGIAEDSTFEDALKEGNEIVVRTFLKNEALRARFVTSKNLILAMELQHTSRRPSDRDEHDPDQDGDSDTETEQQEIGCWTRQNIVLALVEHAKTKSVFNEDVVQTIIECNLDKVWDKRSDQVQLDTSRLLHLAVFYQNVDFVKKFLVEFPQSVDEKALVPGTERPTDNGKGHGYYPLWYNNKMWNGAKWDDREHPSPEIRTELVTATIRGIHKMQRLLEILEQSAEKVNELCFDISQFDSKLYRVRHFAQSLISHRENEGLLSYEPTIKYARFPALDLHPDDKDSFGIPPREEHTEVFDILEWLRNTKKVQCIIELKVPDRLVNPHNELKIAKCLKKFHVEVLDWRFLDLSLSVFPDKVRSRIRGIHLYSSGKRSAINHWLSNDGREGLRSLQNLSWVRIHVIQDLMSASDCKRTCRDINVGLVKLKEDWSKRRASHGVASRELEATVNSQPWNPTREASVDLEEIAQRAFPKLARFISSYRDYANSVLKSSGKDSGSFRRTKVAILDNGILSMLPVSNDTPVRVRARPPKRAGKLRGQGAHSGNERQAGANSRARMRKFVSPRRTKTGEALHETSVSSTDDDDDDDEDEDDDAHTDPNDARSSKGPRTLWSQIQEGRSFVDDDNQVSPWLFASDPHGTQMANLICAIDPHCELYVAKVTDGNRYGIAPHRVERAIEWAREKKVDIISMSFTMFDESDRLYDSIRKANSDDIVMLCSSHDLGANVTKSWPASYPETITIAACDKYGNLPRSFDEAAAKVQYQYKIHGLDVQAGAVPFLASTNTVSGSSAATAIAAGLSSLILSCIRLANPASAGDSGRGKRQTLVKGYLDKMVSSVGRNYLLLEKFGNLDARVKEGELIIAEDILKTSFAGAYERDLTAAS